MSQDSNLEIKRTAIFISGGGSGFGRACALSASKMFKNESLLLICGRNLDNLNETAKMVKEQNESMKVELFKLDLENVTYDEIKLILDRILKDNLTSFDCFLIIHNSGSIGDPSKCSYELIDRVAIESFINVNLTGTIVVNNALLDCICCLTTSHQPLVLVVNVSSLGAIEPLTFCSLYSTAKAAREMFFRCLSNEWSQLSRSTPKLFVINYAPGPMDTAMMSTILDAAPASTFTDAMRQMKDTHKLLAPETSAEKLFRKILMNYSSFQSGSRWDYFDL